MTTGDAVPGPSALAAVGAALGTTVRRASRLTGGHSTANWRLDLAAGPPVVLRTYRAERDACAVEAALLDRLAGTVPVPAVVLADPAGGLVGRPALVTSFVAGLPATTVLRGAAADDVAAVSHAAGVAAAGIASVAFPAAGFLSGAALTVTPFPPGAADALDWVRGRLAVAAGHDGGPPGELLAAWWRLVTAASPALDRVPEGHALVHGDYNPANLLVERPTGDAWRVAAVLDWEFAYAGRPLADVGNWLRTAHRRPPGYAEGFVAGYRAAGGDLPPGWAEAARVLDAMAVADLLARGPAHPCAGDVAGLIRETVARGRL